MTSPAPEPSRRYLGQVLEDADFVPEDILVIRHAYKADGLRSAADVTPDAVRDYTRGQLITGGKFPGDPPRWWLVFTPEPGNRGRLYTVYENAGEVAAERTDIDRFYDLRETDILVGLHDRLVVEWGRDPINWVKNGLKAWMLPVVGPDSTLPS